MPALLPRVLALAALLLTACTTTEVVTLARHADAVNCVAAAPDGRVITGSVDTTVKVWRDGACERTIQAHSDRVWAVAVLPGGARFVSVSDDRTAKLWTLDGALERTFDVGYINTQCVAALPDGVHFVLYIDIGEDEEGQVIGEIQLLSLIHI